MPPRTVPRAIRVSRHLSVCRAWLLAASPTQDDAPTRLPPPPAIHRSTDATIYWGKVVSSLCFPFLNLPLLSFSLPPFHPFHAYTTMTDASSSSQDITMYVDVALATTTEQGAWTDGHSPFRRTRGALTHLARSRDRPSCGCPLRSRRARRSPTSRRRLRTRAMSRRTASDSFTLVRMDRVARAVHPGHVYDALVEEGVYLQLCRQDNLNGPLEPSGLLRLSSVARARHPSSTTSYRND